MDRSAVRPSLEESEAVAALVAALGAVVRADLVDAWSELLAWLRDADDDLDLRAVAAGLFGIEAAPRRPGRRLAALVAALEADAALLAAARDSLGRLLDGLDATDGFGSEGLPSDRGFLAEAADRLTAKVMPRPRDDQDLGQLLRRLLPDRDAALWFRHLPPADLARLLRLLAPAVSAALPRLHRAFADGFRLLAVRLQAQGLARSLRQRGCTPGVEASPFFRLVRASLELADAWEDGRSADPRPWRAVADACRRELGCIHRALGPAGVSVDVVYGLDVLDRCLGRMELMVGVMTPARPAAAQACLRRLLAGLVESMHRDRSLRHLASGGLRRLHQRIVERSGSIGEHYVASGPRDYALVWLRAAGGGVLTAGTAAMKVAISAAHHAFSPLGLGFVYGLNYAASFLLLQRLGLVLATKQPAMTAAHLATIMRDGHGDADRDERIVDMAARICHSQLAAAIANVAVVAVTAFAFDWCWHSATGRHWVAPEEARAIYQALSPVDSGTVAYAALTGVILWASSLVGGWVDNWSAWNRIPQGIADHRLGRRLGRERMARFAERWRTHLAGWATSVSLGLMLGFTPALGEIIGIPLDVRHVTLNSGILSLACAGLEGQWWSGGFFLLAASGIAVMFVLNLGVSFGLSLFTALRAFEVSDAELVVLLRRLVVRLLRRPWQFLLPS